jgi:hypothetical protein
MINFTIESKTLKAALECAGSKDIRFYLNTVHVRVDSGNVYIESTDGHVLFQTIAPFTTDALDQSVMIPRHVVETVLKLKLFKVELKQVSPDQWTLGPMTFKPEDGRFPDLSRVIPKMGNVHAMVDPQWLQFNPELLLKVTKAMRYELENNKHQCYPLFSSGSGGALMYKPGQTWPRCVVMPLRYKEV